MWSWILLSICPYFQLKRNTKGTIYGLSVDMVYWSLSSHVTQLAYGILARTDLSQRLYTNRQQIVSITTSYSIYHLHQIAVWAALAAQVVLYRKTLMREVQGLSWISITITSIYIFVSTILYILQRRVKHKQSENEDWGYATVMWIDWVNWFWMIGKVSESTCMVSQIAVNWKLMSAKVSSRFVWFQLAGLLVGILETPFSIITGLQHLVYAFQILQIITLLIQFRIYRRSRRGNRLGDQEQGPVHEQEQQELLVLS